MAVWGTLPRDEGSGAVMPGEHGMNDAHGV